MDKEKIEALAAAHSLGVLSEEDRLAFEALLKSKNPHAISLHREMREVAALLPLSVEEVAPPADLKDQILSKIAPQITRESAETAAPAAKPDNELIRGLQSGLLWWKRLAIGFAFAAVILLVGSLAYVSYLKNDIKTLSSQVELSGKLIENLKVDLEQKKQVLEVVQAQNTRVFAINRLEAAPENASATVFYAPGQNRAIFYAYNLTPPPAGKDYQLWMLRGNQPVDAGILKADETGRYFVEVNTLPENELSAFAVTLEPKGGAPQPTGAMYLLGTTTRG